MANLIRGSYNGPQYIVTLLRPESVAKHSNFGLQSEPSFQPFKFMSKVHTLLKLFQGESSKQDSVKFEGVVIVAPSYQLFHTLSLFLPRACTCLPRLRLGRASMQALRRKRERESVANLIRGSYNGPQYIVTLLRPESVAKHSITTSLKKV